MIRVTTILIVIFLCLACDDDDSEKKSSCMGEPDPKAICPDVLDPVCGCNGVTYDNECTAKAAGVRSWTEGACD